MTVLLSFFPLLHEKGGRAGAAEVMQGQVDVIALGYRHRHVINCKHNPATVCTHHISHTTRRPSQNSNNTQTIKTLTKLDSKQTKLKAARCPSKIIGAISILVGFSWEQRFP